jgi:hypothetical protein
MGYRVLDVVPSGVRGVEKPVKVKLRLSGAVVTEVVKIDPKAAVGMKCVGR